MNFLFLFDLKYTFLTTGFEMIDSEIITSPIFKTHDKINIGQTSLKAHSASIKMTFPSNLRGLYS